MSSNESEKFSPEMGQKIARLETLADTGHHLYLIDPNELCVYGYKTNGKNKDGTIKFDFSQAGDIIAKKIGVKTKDVAIDNQTFFDNLGDALSKLDQLRRDRIISTRDNISQSDLTEKEKKCLARQIEKLGQMEAQVNYFEGSGYRQDNRKSWNDNGDKRTENGTGELYQKRAFPLEQIPTETADGVEKTLTEQEKNQTLSKEVLNHLSETFALIHQRVAQEFQKEHNYHYSDFLKDQVSDFFKIYDYEDFKSEISEPKKKLGISNLYHKLKEGIRTGNYILLRLSGEDATAKDAYEMAKVQKKTKEAEDQNETELLEAYSKIVRSEVLKLGVLTPDGRKALEQWISRNGEYANKLGEDVLVNQNWATYFLINTVDRLKAVGHDAYREKWKIKILSRHPHKDGAIEIVSCHHGGRDKLLVRFVEGTKIEDEPVTAANPTVSMDQLKQRFNKPRM